VKIGLYDVDSHNFPNLALMKISAYHKAKDDTVEPIMFLKKYDIAYVAKVFGNEYSQMDETAIQADEIIYGGTGFAITVENGKEVYHPEKDKPLPDYIESQYPDYSLYGIKDVAYGFLTRGCPNNCHFCIVSCKEGRFLRKVADLKQFWNGQKDIKLLDANILACKEHIGLLQQLADSKARVDFTQGLDARLLNEENARLLSKIKKNGVHFAFDTIKNEKQILKGLELYKNIVGLGNSDSDRAVYVLTNYDTTFEDDWYRISKLRELGYAPYVMIYRKPFAPKILKYLQRWCNNRFLFNSTDFKDYQPTNSWRIKDKYNV
jgi:hypothetical protein